MPGLRAAGCGELNESKTGGGPCWVAHCAVRNGKKSLGQVRRQPAGSAAATAAPGLFCCGLVLGAGGWSWCCVHEGNGSWHRRSSKEWVERARAFEAVFRWGLSVHHSEHGGDSFVFCVFLF